MEILLDESKHQYTVDGEIADISVTELLAKHGLSPNYSLVRKEKLDERSKVGKEVHKDLEDLLNKARYEPKTEQGKQFLDWVKKNVDCAVGEQKLALRYKDGLLICGTADVIGFMRDGFLFVGDHKNTSAFHREYVTWQVSLLDYIARQCSGTTINGNTFNWVGARDFYCFHYGKGGELKVYELEKIDDNEIERLLDCELKGERYLPQELVVDNELVADIEDLETQIAIMKNRLKETEERAEQQRAKLLQLFEEQQVLSWTSPSGNVRVSYVAPFERMGVDSKALKERYPTIYQEVLKPTKVKASLRINIKGE